MTSCSVLYEELDHPDLVSVKSPGTCSPALGDDFSMDKEKIFRHIEQTGKNIMRKGNFRELV